MANSIKTPARSIFVGRAVISNTSDQRAARDRREALAWPILLGATFAMFATVVRVATANLVHGLIAFCFAAVALTAMVLWHSR
jgi:hypothetical protein